MADFHQPRAHPVHHRGMQGPAREKRFWQDGADAHSCEKGGEGRHSSLSCGISFQPRCRSVCGKDVSPHQNLQVIWIRVEIQKNLNDDRGKTFQTGLQTPSGRTGWNTRKSERWQGGKNISDGVANPVRQNGFLSLKQGMSMTKNFLHPNLLLCLFWEKYGEDIPFLSDFLK